MDYVGNIFRPPAEHRSILLQVSVGCSHNKCTFCGLYKDKRFTIKSNEQIIKDLDYAAKNFTRQKRLFLCDGDALIIPFDRLMWILKMVREKLPWITRVGTYANAKSIKRRTLDELKELKKNKLGIIYLGLESGDDETLTNVVKGADMATQVEQGQKVKQAGMKLSCTVLLGLAGKQRSKIHAEMTGKALSMIDPNHAAALSLMVVPQAPIYHQIHNGEFDALDPYGILEELKLMMEHTTLSAGIFSANHASNYVPIQARFPSGKQEAIDMIESALQGRIALKPESLRGI